MFSGSPMMQHGSEEGPWPLLNENVELFRYWILCVIDDNGDRPPTKTHLLNAEYFDFPQRPLARPQAGGNSVSARRLPRSVIETIEAIQELGMTKRHTEHISRTSEQIRMVETLSH